MLTTPQAINRVVAWHNRHPLAQRITPAQVTGVGVVALPFVAAGPKGEVAVVEPVLDDASEAAPAAGSLRERAQAAAQGAPPHAPPAARASTRPQRPAFSERFLPQPATWRIARFARRFGCAEVPGASTGPCREVDVDAARCGGQGTARLYLGTAAIEDGQRRVRVLWGEGTTPRMLGPRLWSRTRIALLGAASSACVLMAGVLPLAWQHKPGPEAAPALAVASVPPVAAMASAPSTHSAFSAHSAHTAPPAESAVPAASAPTLQVPAPEAAVVAATPPPALASQEAWPPSIRPQIDPGRRRHVRQDSVSLRTAAAAKPEAVAAPRAKPGAAYAVVARSTKSRAASEMLLGFMQSAAGAQSNGSQHTEVVPDAKGWRASWWPFANREEAERARAALAKSGMQVEIVEF